MTPQGLTILGATGTIGVNTLDVVSRHPERFRIIALTGQSQLDKLTEQCLRFAPRYAVVLDAAAATVLRAQLAAAGSATEVLYGADALAQVATLPEVDMVMAAIVGAAGLPPTLAAVHAGKRVLLANKESLVMAGELFMNAVRASGSVLLPIDSEHNAIFQALPADYHGDLNAAGVDRIVLTASGGPFRGWSATQLAEVTPAMAVKHPNWVMGRKISVDSATLMNKGLEVIEARWLFNAAPPAIEVIVHPQSVIHSMVRYRDGSVLAQLGTPDMRTPIAHALAWPGRMDAGVAALDFASLSALTFEAPDTTHFPCLRLAFDALNAGGNAPAVLNAANELAVAAFLDGQLAFTGIPTLVETALTRFAGQGSDSVEALLACDNEVRAFCRQKLA